MAARGGVRQLFRRSMNQLDVVPIGGTEEAQLPFFSPDSQSVGFFANATLKTVSLAGGAPIPLTPVMGTRRGARWMSDGTIVFSYDGAPGLMRVSETGGIPQPITSATSGASEQTHRWLDMLPGGTAVLFTVWTTGLQTAQIAVQSLDGGDPKLLLAGTNPHYVPTGHIVFARENSLWAVAFDARRLEVTGDPRLLVPDVWVYDGGLALYALANDGSLLYVPIGPSGNRTLVWVDREGREELVPRLRPGDYRTARVSPNGLRLAMDDCAPGGFCDLWTYDVARATQSRLTTYAGQDSDPLWTGDGQRVVFSSDRDGQDGLFWKAWDGTGDVERLVTREPAAYVWPRAWSSDGLTLVFDEARAGTIDIGVLSMDSERAARVLIQTEFVESNPAVSPDGSWMAYDANTSGQFEVYVQRFPTLGGLQKISIDGGNQPLWSPDGRELFYRSLDGTRLMVVTIETGPAITAGDPELVFEGQYFSNRRRNYDIAPDGQRFLMIKEGGDNTEQFIVVQNWFEEIKRLVPTP